MRNKITFLLTFWIIVILPFSCNQPKEGTITTEEELMTAKTLGLAYLEENKLEEAENEFLRIVDYDQDEVLGYANLGLVYLRMGQYEEAEEWLQEAIEMNPEDPDVRLILAKVYEQDNQPQKAIEELEEAVGSNPNHIKSLYNLTELYAASDNEDAQAKRKKYTELLIENAPGNVVPRLNLIEILIKEGNADKALAQLEELQQIYPEFPKEAVDYFNNTIASLNAGNTEEAAISFMVFHNYLKVTAPYQAGIKDLKGPGGALIGDPVITFDQQTNKVQARDWQEILAAIKFNDITLSAGLDMLNENTGSNTSTPTPMAAADYDSDGDIDLYIGVYNASTERYEHYLLNNDWGKFTDVTKEAGLRHEGMNKHFKFADFDNDGYLDLFVVNGKQNILYQNSGEGTFSDITKKSGINETDGGNKSLFFDYDHDGDLDLYIARDNLNRLYRNNMDGTFTELAEDANLAGGNVATADAQFGDFDDDGDIDLFITNSDASNKLYSNQRQGVFRDITDESGMNSEGGATALSVGDFNNDGFLDLFVAFNEPEKYKLYSNLGNGTFETDNRSDDITKNLEDVQVSDATFMDFDNDGYLDIFVAGTVESDAKNAAFLFHNDKTGKFYVTENILPEDLKTGKKILTFDYNADGDLDAIVSTPEGSVRFLRNDGGNNNHYVKMKLVGLRTGSGKNNYYGIGAKVEIRAGNLYQSKVVTSPDIHFGLGPRNQADVIRILWTNGVPQNMFFPGTNQNLVEEQILKGSCPFLYAWNGEKYVFVKDIMWKSALGMPLGLMGEDKTAKYASPAASVDFIKIPGEFLKLDENKYKFQLTAELWETIYADKIQLIALDHPDSVDVFVDERFTPFSNYNYELFQVSNKRLPVSATDADGNNQLPAISKEDDNYVSSLYFEEFQGVTDLSNLTLDLGNIDNSKNLRLFLNGWVFPTDASINYSIGQSGKITTVAPQIQAINKKGEWETIVENFSFPMGKDKTIVVDLTGKIPTLDARIRIRTNMQIYWDHIFFSNDETAAPVNSYKMNPSFADFHYRGFSRPFRKGGRYGPHWFDYDSVTTEQKWRDLTGYYTRYGDVLPLLMEADDMYIIYNAGDETTIEFDASALPKVPAGWKRDFLIHSVGWVKDGDLNTAAGQTVEPLPFHEASKYPYGTDESYPTSQKHKEYLKKYNTRKVTTKEFQTALSNSGKD